MNLSISQSMIKAFDAENYCPMKLKKLFIDQTHSLIPSLSMDKGVYFESMCLGSGAKGKILTDLPRKKNGTKTADQIRIEQQAALFPEILKAHSMSIIGTDIFLEYTMEDGIKVNGTIDFTSSIWDDREGPIDKALVDLKLTATVYSDYGDYCWNTPHKMNHLQAFMYTYLWEKIYGERLNFYYLIFDYKPKPEYKIIKKLVGMLEEYSLQESIRKTVAKINHHESVGYSTVGLIDNCRNCPLQSICSDAKLTKKIQTV